MTDASGSDAARRADDLRLLRAFEPVVRLTQGEYFVPVGVGAYVRRCDLWLRTPEGTVERVAEQGTLDLDSLARLGAQREGAGYSLSAISVSQTRRTRFKKWFRTERPKFRAGHRLAEVGLTGRAVDTLSRLSLLFRGAVPGGSAVASLAIQNEHLHPETPTYHGHVVREGGWIVCQYWFFYSFNNWRSAFSGVNEHESDWEQVTVFLDGTGALDADGLPEPRWVVFSAHDEVGDDLRRRWDDPDLMHVDGRHPVVFAGAGSHSGAYLPGDYLITVAPEAFSGLISVARRFARIFTPWTRAAQGAAIGIPYIDYARGDGLSIGPGQGLEWTPVVIDNDTPWVRDYRGLWGHDTRDRLGGERGPAGPRYDRNASVRSSWGDPVGWSGLGKVAPNRAVELEYVARRIGEIDAELAQLDEATDVGLAAISARAAGLVPDAPEVRGLAPEETRLLHDRMTAVRLRDARLRMVAAQRDGIPVSDPHAHLNHRRLPIAVAGRGRSRFLGVWAIISTPLILLLIGTLFVPAPTSRLILALWMLILVLGVEAFARGYFLAYLWRAALLLLAVDLLILFVGQWQWLIASTLAVLAIVVLLVNIRDARRG